MALNWLLPYCFRPASIGRVRACRQSFSVGLIFLIDLYRGNEVDKRLAFGRQGRKAGGDNRRSSDYLWFWSSRIFSSD